MPGDNRIDRSRRAFLRRPLAGLVEARDQSDIKRTRDTAADPWRPPWASATFEDACTRCGACLEACPEGILVKGDGGFPEVDVTQGSGECTFCQACVDACPEPAFEAPDTHSPWDWVARIGSGCLATNGIVCQTCGDVCDYDAIPFAPEESGPPVPWLNPDSCTGCGACVAACPAQVIKIVHHSRHQAN
ncbi:ferredoxin-type protein NapF [Rhodovibrio salinarum]|uniref:Ferredoxin-type protein NapF n=1 Tax=Rhodovibrio salinarum TaxID=1087 RepID=A0A934QL23_9PROT|nr:ferredoxin-type protein NapF [Rhodovibrio salinarum]MBK1698901.1 ferredoxin-type protein NapF [Rhodovibrio salinarum]